MKRITSTAFLLAVSSVLLGAIPSQAQTTASQQGYLTLPPSSSNANNSGTLYSPQEYPTAQGRYLTLPPGYQQKPAATAARYAPPLTVTPPAAAVASNQVQLPPQTVPAQPHPVYGSTSVPIAKATTTAYAPATVSTPVSVSAPVPVQTVAATSFDQLPSYTYNPSLDPKNVPYKTPMAHDPRAASKGEIALGTIPGSQLTGQFSLYRYQEQLTSGTDFVRSTGPKGGLVYDYDGGIGGTWFWNAEVRGAWGENDYTGSGHGTGISDWIFEVRGLVGKDFIFNEELWGFLSFDISPYAGLGFRYLFNEFSSFPGGYDRFSHYFYLPLGLTDRFRVTDTSRISLNMEFDKLLYGWQVSQLSQANPGLPDITNAQYHGYGVRGSAMWEWKTWAFGPYFNYWNIGESDLKCDTGSAFIFCGVEPNNQTLEVGAQVKYRF